MGVAGDGHSFAELPAETQFIFRVKAVAGDLESDYSAPLALATLAAPAEPETVGVPDNFREDTPPTTTTISATWDPPDGGADSYTLRYEDPAMVVRTATSELNSITVTGLEPETTYTLFVRAHRGLADGTEIQSAYSASITLTTLPVIVAKAYPENLRTTGRTDSTISLAWNVLEGATEYEVGFVAVGGEEILGVTDRTSHTLTGLASRTTYTIRVRGYVNNRAQEWSPAIEATSDDYSIRSFRLGQITDTTAKINWARISAAIAYQVETGAADSAGVSDLPVTAGSFEAEGLTPGQNYAFRIRAQISAEVYGPWTPQIKFTTLLVIPPPADLMATSFTANSVSLSWTAAATAPDAYVVSYGVFGSLELPQSLATTSTTATLRGLVAGTR